MRCCPKSMAHYYCTASSFHVLDILFLSTLHHAEKTASGRLNHLSHSSQDFPSDRVNRHPFRSFPFILPLIIHLLHFFSFHLRPFSSLPSSIPFQLSFPFLSFLYITILFFSFSPFICSFPSLSSLFLSPVSFLPFLSLSLPPSLPPLPQFKPKRHGNLILMLMDFKA